MSYKRLQDVLTCALPAQRRFPMSYQNRLLRCMEFREDGCSMLIARRNNYPAFVFWGLWGRVEECNYRGTLTSKMRCASSPSAWSRQSPGSHALNRAASARHERETVYRALLDTTLPLPHATCKSDMSSPPPAEDSFTHTLAIKLSRALNIVNPNDLLAQRVQDIAKNNTLEGFASGTRNPSSSAYSV